MRFSSFARLLLAVGDLRMASTLYRAGVAPHYLAKRPAGMEIEPLGITVDQATRWPWVLSRLDLAASLKANAGAIFRTDLPDLVIECAGVSYLIRTSEELFTLNEILVERVYDFACPGPCVLLDVGMNVGFASLTFAAKPAVIAVYSYEPFPETYAQARSCIQLNPDISNKILTFNAGVGGVTGQRTGHCDPALKGSARISGSERATVERGLEVTVEVLSIVDVIAAIRQRHPKDPLVAKIDCEGAEYEIIEKLAAERLLGDLAAVMIEWHRFTPDQTPERLAALLCQAGFIVFLSGPPKGLVGMIYGVHG